MIVVDSSVWIDYFNNRKVPSVELLAHHFDSKTDILLFSVILLEVLSGFKNDRDFALARQAFEDFPILALSKETHISGASLFRKLRRKGVTIRKPVDCLIAQACVETGARLLTTDRDFHHIARHSALKLVY